MWLAILFAGRGPMIIRFAVSFVVWLVIILWLLHR